jgi:ribonuclease BN (tRNA processing enzyme)
MKLHVLGSGGGAPSETRETACYLLRDERRALILDSGTGARRLLTCPDLLNGIGHLDVLLTHFHLDHVCGLPYLRMLELDATIWAPGRWLYNEDSDTILEPLRRPPIAPTDVTEIYPVRELREGRQEIDGFDVCASAQPNHWSPSAGLRIDDELALITDTPYEKSSCDLARGVRHLLHEAWSSSSDPQYAERDATGADAANVANDAGVAQLTLIHLNPTFRDHAHVLADAARTFDHVQLGVDGDVLEIVAEEA